MLTVLGGHTKDLDRGVKIVHGTHMSLDVIPSFITLDTLREGTGITIIAMSDNQGHPCREKHNRDRVVLETMLAISSRREWASTAAIKATNFHGGCSIWEAASRRVEWEFG